MTREEKLVYLIANVGLTYEEAENSWALANWEEAMELDRFFGAWIATLRNSVVS